VGAEVEEGRVAGRLENEVEGQGHLMCEWRGELAASDEIAKRV